MIQRINGGSSLEEQQIFRGSEVRLCLSPFLAFLLLAHRGGIGIRRGMKITASSSGCFQDVIADVILPVVPQKLSSGSSIAGSTISWRCGVEHVALG